MKRGPKPKIKPDVLKFAPPGEPRKPSWLTKEAAAEWDALAPDLVAIGVLTPLHGMAFGLLCLASAGLAQALKGVAEQGEKTTSQRGGDRLSVPKRIENYERERLERMLAEFGLTPSSESRVTRSPSATPTKLDLLIQGKKAR